ncbi:MAG: hypothetical protein US94_C0005G0005 [Berkelbacteria bacterium GW2011_GWB1_38_5]|uniref:Uncharacterized protein n=1 Tax=Berkelbacteria bacterium GW2011_GWB1_38_5 TaxID=1618336 RepID=A0A0G0ML00_9BACT|nr:MAG: hypothetical protein US94_C0005G0005 [Berkelbacteria bacterium GW2011_GWB1_38_5]
MAEWVACEYPIPLNVGSNLLKNLHSGTYGSITITQLGPEKYQIAETNPQSGRLVRKIVFERLRSSKVAICGYKLDEGPNGLMRALKEMFDRFNQTEESK